MQETAEPIALSIGLRKQACVAIKRAITEMNIYGHPLEIRLDERQLSQDLGMSRTPVREALSVLEQEGFVRSVPRRGLIVVRKSKREVVEMITVWAAIESMAARLAAPRVTDADLAELHALVDVFQEDPSEQISEYSQRQHGVPQGDHPHGRRGADDQPDRQPVHPHARGPRRDHDAGQPRATLDRRSSRHHRRAGAARRRRGRDGWCASTRWGWRRMSSSTAIFSTDRRESDDERRRQYA